MDHPDLFLGLIYGCAMLAIILTLGIILAAVRHWLKDDDE